MKLKQYGQMTESAYNIWQHWKPSLEDATKGPVITNRADQEAYALVLEHTVAENAKWGIMKGLDPEKDKGADLRSRILEEAETYSNSWSSAANTGYQGTDTIGGYAKRLPLMFRRGVTELVAPAFMGMQAMDAPQAFVYTVKGRYKGSGEQKIPIGQGNFIVLSTAISGSNWIADISTAITAFNAGVRGHVTQANSGATGIVRHVNGTKIFVERVGATTFTENAADTLSVGNGTVASPGAAGQDARVVSAVFDDEAGYKQFFENYTRADYTEDYVDFDNADNNTQGFSEASTEIREMGIDIAQSRVQAQTRKVKSSWPIEVEEDLSRNAQLNFMTEIMNEMYREMNLNMNREMVRLINDDATQVPSFDLDTGSDGRWFVEKIMGFVSHIDAQAEAIRIDTRRGIGNRLLVSPLVRVALSQLPIWTQNNIQGTSLMGAQSYAGNLGGKYDVHVDIFADEDYCNVAYRGSNTDAGYFWCPYIGLTFAESKHPEHLFDRITGLRTRYGILRNPFGPDLYYRYMPVTGLSQIGISF